MRTLLLADDSVTTQRVVALTFSDESFRVVTVSDGQQAIDSMAVMRPDIVLAGTTLPRTNGYELAEYMRGIPSLKDVPVLLLSGAFESVDSARLKASGARGVVEKPLEPTTVISRVKELLGLKDARPTPPTGRLVTSAETPADRKPAPRAAAAPPSARTAPVASWDQLRQDSGLEPDARSVEGVAPGREDYFDTLDAAFDSLDQHLAGRHPAANAKHRNPSPPLGQASGAADPRSPGRRPTPPTEGASPNSVFEVDADWFADDSRKARDLDAQRDMVADAHEAMPARPPATPGNPIFEVDDEWFAEDEKAREARRNQQQELAAEMGIHDVELPEVEPGGIAPAPAADLDFDFGLDDLAPRGQAKQGPTPDSPFAPPAQGPMAVPKTQAPLPSSVEPPATPAAAPVALAPPVPAAPATTTPVAPAPPAPAPVAPVPSPLATQAPLAPLPPSAAVPAPVVPSSVADDFAALLAFETGDAPPRHEPAAAPAPPPVVIQAVAPEITDEMLDHIAQRVAERLNAGTFGTGLRDAMAVAIRDTVRSVVSETSERLVRDEIARVKARVERDTQ